MGFRVLIVAALLLGGCRSVNVETEPVTGRVLMPDDCRGDNLVPFME